MDNTTGLRVIIVGQAAAGKTTLALKVKELLEQAGATVLTLIDEDVNIGTAYEDLQTKRWGAVKDRPIEIVTQQQQKNFKKVASKEKTLARYVVQSPLTCNACHMISWPDAAGLVYVSDLDMGEVYQVALSDLLQQPMFRPVEEDDFGFSWVVDGDHLDDELYEWVMEQSDAD